MNKFESQSNGQLNDQSNDQSNQDELAKQSSQESEPLPVKDLLMQKLIHKILMRRLLLYQKNHKTNLS